jgi:hypothetical protein
MRPDDVRQWFSGEVSDELVQLRLAALRTDRDWTVFDPIEAAPEWLIQMVYHPTGAPLGFRALRVHGSTWRFLS